MYRVHQTFFTCHCDIPNPSHIFYLLNNLIDHLIWRQDWFVPDRVLPGFGIEVASSIDANIELEPNIMIKD